MIELNKNLLVGLIIFALVSSLAIGAKSVLADPNGSDHLTMQPPASDEGSAITVESASASVGRIKYKGTLLQDVNMKAGTKKNKCHWVNGGFNSGHSADGSLKWFHDPVRAKICKNPNSPTGWVKVAGGTTGRHCFNPFKPHGKPPGPVIRGPVVMVRSFEKLNLNVKAVANARVRGERTCPDGAVLSGHANGRAAANVRVTKKMLTKAGGDTENLKIVIKQNILAKAKANAKAKVKLDCGEAPPANNITPPPEQPMPPEEENITTAVKIVKKADEAPSPQQPPAESVPAALPDTGPGDIAATFLGVSSLSGLIYRVVARRFGLD